MLEGEGAVLGAEWAMLEAGWETRGAGEADEVTGEAGGEGEMVAGDVDGERKGERPLRFKLSRLARLEGAMDVLARGSG